MDVQNIENVTEHLLLGLIVDKPRSNANGKASKREKKKKGEKRKRKKKKKEKKKKRRSNNCFFFLGCNVSSHRYQKGLLQRPHKTSRRLSVSSVG